LLATYPWQTAPLIIELDQDNPLSVADSDTIQKTFERRRNASPDESALYIVTPEVL
jgi:hypothetical protein